MRKQLTTIALAMAVVSAVGLSGCSQTASDSSTTSKNSESEATSDESKETASDADSGESSDASSDAGTEDPATGSKAATTHTAAKNQTWYDILDFDDESEKECALKGLIEAPEALIIYDEEGNEVWNVADYAFTSELDTIPDTINPSLWRNTLYNSYAGLFKVCDGIYQVRGYDMANATFIQTDNGWIVFDVLMCKQNMKEAKKIMEKHFGELDIKAVLYSHCHIDHYGGIYGLIDKEDAADPKLPLKDQLASGKIPVLAPDGFLEHAVSENIYAGKAMGRRAMYQYGTLLKPGEKGKLAMGIGLGQAVGNTGLLAPTYNVEKNETITIDGLKIEFQLTPGTEAPAEMNAFFPKYDALWLAENCTGTMHNLYTLRGAQVRDASEWARYILEAEQMFGDDTEVVFQSHNWPHWGKDTIREYMENTAAVYQYINDQTLHYINLGYTAAEISNMLELPEELNKVWYTRQYYGTLSHNIKAVYQKYMGWYDANPVNLNPLSPEDSAKKLVEYLGDVNEVLKKARKDFENGEYQWVAEITKELVYADPKNQEARNLCADALEQLGYQSESGTWRNCYLTAALELRLGNQANNAKSSSGGMDVWQSMTADMILDYLDIFTDAKEAENDDLTMNLILKDTEEKFFIKRKAGVLLVYSDTQRDNADCTVTGTKANLLGLMSQSENALEGADVEGDETVPERLIKYMINPEKDFNIIEP